MGGLVAVVQPSGTEKLLMHLLSWVFKQISSCSGCNLYHVLLFISFHNSLCSKAYGGWFLTRIVSHGVGLRVHSLIWNVVPIIFIQGAVGVLLDYHLSHVLSVHRSLRLHVHVSLRVFTSLLFALFLTATFKENLFN